MNSAFAMIEIDLFLEENHQQLNLRGKALQSSKLLPPAARSRRNSMFHWLISSFILIPVAALICDNCSTTSAQHLEAGGGRMNGVDLQEPKPDPQQRHSYAANDIFPQRFLISALGALYLSEWVTDSSADLENCSADSQFV